MVSSDMGSTRPYESDSWRESDAVSSRSRDHTTDELDFPNQPRTRPISLAATTPIPASSSSDWLDEAWENDRYVDEGPATTPIETSPAPRAARRSREAPAVPTPPRPVAEYAAPAVSASAHAATPAAMYPVAPATVSRPPGPGGVARFMSLLLCIAFTVTSFVMLWMGFAQAITGMQQMAVSGEQQAAGGFSAPVISMLGSALAAFLASVTARLSGLGPGIVGFVLTVGGLVVMLVPSLIIPLIAPLIGAPDLQGVPVIGDMVQQFVDGTVQSLAAMIASLALLVGALLLGTGVASHGARRAGWRRGGGRR